MTRSLRLLVAAALVALLAATAASGARPVREPIFFEDFLAEGICPFPVLIEVTANKEFVTFFKDGRIHVTGKLFARVTNLNSDESLDLNISGPALISAESERLHGRGLFIAFPEDVGGPGLVLTTGRVDVIRGEDGFVDEFDVRGRSIDVCAALAQ
jgi:hypothetical protein